MAVVVEAHDPVPRRNEPLGQALLPVGHAAAGAVQQQHHRPLARVEHVHPARSRLEKVRLGIARGVGAGHRLAPADHHRSDDGADHEQANQGTDGDERRLHDTTSEALGLSLLNASRTMRASSLRTCVRKTAPSVDPGSVACASPMPCSVCRIRLT